MSSSEGCRSCIAELEHCHGTLVLHRDGSVECTDPECRHADDGHDSVVPCDEIAPPCSCA